MPSPTAESVNDILEQLKAACERGVREPTTALEPDQHAIMLDLHIHDPFAAGVMLQHLREHARTLEGWTATEARRINFRLYVEGARAYTRQQENIESAANVVRMSTQRQARLRRARVHDVTGDASHGLTTEQMLETESPLLVAFGLLRQHRMGRIWYDEFRKCTMTDWRGGNDGTVIEPRIVTDENIYRIQRWLQSMDKRLVRLGAQAINQLADAMAYEDKRNGPRDWIFSLRWDGIPRLADVMREGFGAPDTPFNRAAGRCWFVSMVARVFKPGCKVDTMPVFIGPQGIMKSQALEVIGGEWYAAAASSIDHKDFLQELHGVLLLEVPELHSMLSSRMGAARIKAVLSTRIDNFRLPYGMRVEKHQRTCVICGTTNNRDWHTDETGGRRYWPVHCGGINLTWLRRHRAQLFAEAWTYYAARNAAISAAITQARAEDPTFDAETFVEPDEDVFRLGQWWNVPSAEQVELIDAETFVSPWQATIEARLAASRDLFLGRQGERPTPWDGTASESTDWGNTLTITRIGVQWLGLSLEQLGRGSVAGKTISAIMRGLGFELRRQRVPGMVTSPHVFHMNSSGASRTVDSLNSENQMEHMEQTEQQNSNRSDDDDIPF